MKRAQRATLRRLALKECARILESAIGTDLQIYKDHPMTRDESNFVEKIMREVSDRLYASAEVKP